MQIDRVNVLAVVSKSSSADLKSSECNTSGVTPVGDCLSMSSGTADYVSLRTVEWQRPRAPVTWDTSEGGSEAPAGPLDTVDVNAKSEERVFKFQSLRITVSGGDSCALSVWALDLIHRATGRVCVY